jgi:transposase
LEICKALKREYGNLTKLIKLSKNTSNLSRKLQEFKGIGPTTARIFIRDLKRFKVI